MTSLRKAAVSAALFGAALTGGAVGASMIGTASAQTDSSSSSSTNSTAPADPATSATKPAHDPSKGGHQANGITEDLLAGDGATQVTAAAQGAVPDGTIERVENDADGAAFEAHMVKADGTRVTVKVNADFSVAGIETGHGR